MQDPAGLYRLETDIDLADAGAPALIVALAGFFDAGAAQALVVRHLMERLDHRVVATFDIDQLLDYRGRRPVMTYAADHWSEYEDPTLALYRFVDDEGTPFLLLLRLLLHCRRRNRARRPIRPRPRKENAPLAHLLLVISQRRRHTRRGMLLR